jgi:zinc transport system substrate-binding protein
VGCATVLALTLAGCGSQTETGSADAPDDKLPVVASFYPLQYIAERVGGDAVQVTTLTAPGVEPHDLELTPKQVGAIAAAKVVVYEQSLQPAVDKAVKQNAAKTAFDISPAAKLVATGVEEHADEHADNDHVEDKDAAVTEGEALDPHFWLDPQRYADVATAVADRLAEADSGNADAYRQRAATLRTELTKLDGEFKAGLRNCQRKTFVTSHDAFAYLAQRYGLEMVGIAGLTPDAEPSPARIKEVQDVVRRERVTTIFYEELVSPKVAESIARDLGVRTAVLSPIEGLSESTSTQDYLSLMRQNLQELRKANGCT